MLLATCLIVAGAVVTSALQTLPPVLRQETTSNDGLPFDLFSGPRTIYIDPLFAQVNDTDGLSLIAPTAGEFAEVFRQDLALVVGEPWTLEVLNNTMPEDAAGIHLETFSGDRSQLAYENGKLTEEGYEMTVNEQRVTIRGAGARGMFWGTRTLLQQAMISNGSISAGRILDAPAYATRGFMLDAGRKWYAPKFLKELCAYASMFKMSEFHYHLSDNYPLTRGRNETWQDIYSHFSLMPEDPALKGIIQRPNETLSRTDFEDFQRSCAARGITVIPEIEAPGHCLAITKWKPEIALKTRDLLNLTHPDSIPTVQSLWKEFLPWFATKEVHIGADEYDSTLADDYIKFVNEMSAFIKGTSGKTVRIWGTDEPSDNLIISKDVVVQHWQYGQSDPFELQKNGYDLINSNDQWAYLSLKNDHMPIVPAPYPQFFNESRVLHFAGQPDQQWTPALSNQVNLTMQLAPSASHIRGAIMAAWNDNGPDATTQLEAYYAMRRGIPLVAARAWTGSRGPPVIASDLDPSIEMYSMRAPGQNLDRNIVSAVGNMPGILLSWTRRSNDEDLIWLGHGSKGMNYSLTLSASGPFELSGPDSALSLTGNGSLIFAADGWQYPLRSVAQNDGFDAGAPGRIWVNKTSSTHTPLKVSTPANITINTDALGGSRVWINGAFVGRFEVFVYGGKNTMFSWSQMAFVAPLDSISGAIQSLVLRSNILAAADPSLEPFYGSSSRILDGDSVLKAVLACCMTLFMSMIS